MIKEIKIILNNRLIFLLTIFSAFVFIFQFISIKTNSGYLYTELQKSHFENGKYRIINNLWMECKTEIPLSRLVFDHLENGKRIEFGYLINRYQDRTWTFFHDNSTPSMTNLYKNGEFVETTQSWDIHGNLINNNY